MERSGSDAGLFAPSDALNSPRLRGQTPESPTRATRATRVTRACRYRRLTRQRLVLPPLGPVTDPDSRRAIAEGVLLHLGLADLQALALED